MTEMILAPMPEVYVDLGVSPPALTGGEPVEGPVQVGDLNRWDLLDTQLTTRAALKIGLPVASAAAGFMSTVVVRDFRWYCSTTDGELVREYGTSVRIVITAWEAKLEGNLTLPSLAAKAQLGAVQSSSHISILGFRDPAVGRLLPAFSTLGVDSYSDFMKATDAARVYISDHSGAVDPVLLRESKPDASEDFAEAVVTTRTLRCIAERKTLASALRGIEPASAAAENARRLYGYFLPGASADSEPTGEVVARAKTWLAGLE